MARIRSIKPEFFTSLTIGALSPVTRLTFIGLWTYVDDDGIALDDARLVRAAVCPLADRKLTGVEADLCALEKARLIVRYEANGERYLAVRNWLEHQRISHPRPKGYPPPPASTTLAKGSRTIPEPFRNHSASRGRGEERKGKERKGKEEDARQPAVLDVEKSIDEIIRLANRGMLANPAIGDACQPIPIGHGSRQKVADWLNGGVAADLAQAIVFQRAKEWIPDGRRRQITTMGYFDAAVREENERRGARNGADPQHPPGPDQGPRPPTEIEAWAIEHPEEFAEIKRKALEDGEASKWWATEGDFGRRIWVDGVIHDSVRAVLRAGSG